MLDRSSGMSSIPKPVSKSVPEPDMYIQTAPGQCSYRGGGDWITGSLLGPSDPPLDSRFVTSSMHKQNSVTRFPVFYDENSGLKPGYQRLPGQVQWALNRPGLAPQLKIVQQQLRSWCCDSSGQGMEM